MAMELEEDANGRHCAGDDDLVIRTDCRSRVILVVVVLARRHSSNGRYLGFRYHRR